MFCIFFSAFQKNNRILIKNLFYLGKLVLKIPFKDMWNGQIDAIVEDLFILIVPTSQVQYDAEKEAKAQLETKRAELARVENSKRLAELKCKSKY